LPRSLSLIGFDPSAAEPRPHLYPNLASRIRPRPVRRLLSGKM